MRVTFKKDKSQPHCCTTYTIKVDGFERGHIQQTGRQWFWYGDGQNTCHEPKTLDACKADIKAHFAKNLARERNFENE